MKASIINNIIYLCILYYDLATSYYQTSLKVKHARKSLYISASYTEDNLIVDDVIKTRVKIAGDRYMIPGDYIVHEKYGIGKYIGIKQVNINPNQPNTPTIVEAVVIQYKDCKVTWFKKLIENEVWIYRTSQLTGGSSIEQEYELNSILDLRKWNKRKENIEATSKNMAMNLINLMAVRNNIQRLPCIPDDEEYQAFEQAFPFTPTNDQLLCFQQVAADMINTTRPMDRLICGDVGFGKTEVAIRAIYRAVKSNKQVALLAPTRVLAKQHERTLISRMPDVNIKILRGGTKKEATNQIKKDLKDGKIRVIVGTHALLQSTVEFDNLGLLVVDEEQRFGVNQKEKLKSVAAGADVLTLSATPIPRTLQLSLSGLRDFSAMKTPPSGRKEVIVYVGSDGGTMESLQTASLNHVPTTSSSASIIDTTNYNPGLVNSEEMIKYAISEEIKREGQVFVVVPYIKDIDEIVIRLKDMKIPGPPSSSSKSGEGTVGEVRIIEAHGQHEDLEDRVEAFLRKEASILVATTVIENGIDMPNVNTIIVFSADRFGMSSLYQLKGRVGRSSRQAYAYFLTKRNDSITAEAEHRLTYLKTFTALGSGYDLSRRDMEMRGHGTLFGAEQSGIFDIGLDLQSKILSNALDGIKKDMILSIPECKVEIYDEIELFGKNQLNTSLQVVSHIPLSSSLSTTSVQHNDDMNMISRWEAKVIEEIIKTYILTSTLLPSSSSSLNNISEIENNLENQNTNISKQIKTKNILKSKLLKKNKDISSIPIDENHLKLTIIKKLHKNFISATTIQEVKDAIDNLKKHTNISSELIQAIEYRYRLRICLRTIGISELKAIIPKNHNTNNNIGTNVNYYEYIMKAPELTLSKWEKLLKRLPQESSERLEYRSVALNNNTVSGALRFRYYITNCDPNSSIDNISNTSKQILLETLELCANEVRLLLSEMIQLQD